RGRKRRRAGSSAGGRLRRHGHALHRRPRRGRRARRRPAEPRDVLAGGARGTGQAGPALVAAGTHVRDQGGHVRGIRKRSRVSVVVVAAVAAALALVVSACGGGSAGGGSVESTTIGKG